MKKLIIFFLIILVIAFIPVSATEVRIYETKDLTYEILADRVENHDIIIEKVIGVVINENGDGQILNGDPECNYISYRYVENAEIGDIVLTLCIYNPDTDYEDDIIDRCDFIID